MASEPRRILSPDTESAEQPSLVDLLRRGAQGNQEAFARLYDLTAATLHPLAMRITESAEDAEEVLFDVYLRVWRHAHLYEERRGTVLAWLLILTRGAAIQRVRDRRDRAAETPAETLDAFTARESATIPGDTVQHRVRAALNRLPGPEREVLALAFYEGLSHAQLAEYLATPLPTIQSRARNGLRRLREYLKEPA